MIKTCRSLVCFQVCFDALFVTLVERFTSTTDLFYAIGIMNAVKIPYLNAITRDAVTNANAQIT